VTSKKILVVDDSPTVRQKVGIALQHAGFEMAEATDGAEGLRVLEKGGISLVICDVNMPRMSGLEMLEHLRRNHRYANLPVVMLTTESLTANVERATKAGAKAWIMKPFKVELLIAAVRKHAV
jgi:two-component system chemotaxis response regulator CheY